MKQKRIKQLFAGLLAAVMTVASLPAAQLTAYANTTPARGTNAASFAKLTDISAVTSGAISITPTCADITFTPQAPDVSAVSSAAINVSGTLTPVNDSYYIPWQMKVTGTSISTGAAIYIQEKDGSMSAANVTDGATYSVNTTAAQTLSVKDFTDNTGTKYTKVLPSTGEAKAVTSGAIVCSGLWKCADNDPQKYFKIYIGKSNQPSTCYTINYAAVEFGTATKVKQNQAKLNITPVTGKKAGDTFNLTTTGGSGTGAVTYIVTSGSDVLSVTAAGAATAKKAGTATVKATKAGDDDYNPAEATLDITIGSASTPTPTPENPSNPNPANPSNPTTPDTDKKPDGTVTETKPDGTVVETKPDGTVTESKTETAADGSTTDTTTVTKPNGNTTETVVEKNKDGEVVKSTETVTKKDKDGAVTSIVEKTEIPQSSATTSTKVTVKKDSEEKVVSAAATVENTVESGNKATLTAAVAAQITDAAGTGSVDVTMTVKDTDGAVKFKVQVNTEDLEKGNDLYIYKKDANGNYVMVNAKTYTVNENGGVSVSMAQKGTYQLVDAKEAKKIEKEIKKTITPKKAAVDVKAGKKATFALSKKANKASIKSITYTTGNKSVVTVNKNGKITAKGKGTVTVKAKVTLKNGSTKTIKMKVKVK